MNISDMRLFRPFRCESGRVILSPPDAWREVEKWQSRVQWVVEESGMEFSPLPTINVLVQPDPFAEYEGDICNDRGKRVYTDGHTWTAMDPVSATMTDVLRDLFALSDRTPLLTFWIPTRHPERVRETIPPIGRDIIPDDDCGIPVKNPLLRKNLRLGIYESICTGVAHQMMLLQEMTTWRRISGGCFILRDSGDVEVASQISL